MPKGGPRCRRRRSLREEKVRMVVRKRAKKERTADLAGEVWEHLRRIGNRLRRFGDKSGDEILGKRVATKLEASFFGGVLRVEHRETEKSGFGIAVDVLRSREDGFALLDGRDEGIWVLRRVVCEGEKQSTLLWKEWEDDAQLDE
jgi:hypothetical protein